MQPARTAAVRQHRTREQEQHHHLTDQEDAQDLGRDLQVEVGQHRGDGEHRQGEHLPRPVDAELRREGLLREVREDPDDRRLEDHVRQHRQQARGHAYHPAQTVRDEPVERPGGGDVPGHRDVADGEDRQYQGDEQEGRGACTPLPPPTMTGRLPVMAVIGAAVASAMKTTPARPTEFVLSCWTAGGPAGDLSLVGRWHVVLPRITGLDGCAVAESGQFGVPRCGRGMSTLYR